MLRSGQKGNRQKPYKKENPSDPIGGNPAGIAKVIRAFIHEYNSNSAQEKSYRAVADRRQQKTLTWTKTATVLVGVYTGVTIVLAIIRGRQLNVSEDSEQRQLRAYVGAVGMELSCGNCLPTVKDQIYLSTENFGQTPAYLIQGTIWPYEYSIGRNRHHTTASFGVPGVTRTRDPQFRKLLLYPAELRGPGGR